MTALASTVIEQRHLERANRPAIGASAAPQNGAAASGASASGQARTHRHNSCVYPRARVQLAQDVLHMNFHGGFGNVEFACDQCQVLTLAR